MSPRYAVTCLIASVIMGGCNPRPAAHSIADLTPPDPEPGASAAPAETTPANQLPDAFAGRWFVSDVYPAGVREANPGDPHVGVSLVIGRDEVSDVNGQRCVAPQIAIEHDRAPLRLGEVAVEALDRLIITCKGQPFASYLLLPGRVLDLADRQDASDNPSALVASRPEAQYLLERADQILLRQATLAVGPGGGDAKSPSAMAFSTPTSTLPSAPETPSQTLHAPLALAPEPPVPATEPVPVAKPPAKADAKPAELSDKARPVVTAASGTALPASGAAVHLASYAGISAAKRGWKTLLGEFDVLDPLTPLYVTVDVPGKGQMIRLYAEGGDRASLQQVCASMMARGSYCVLSR